MVCFFCHRRIAGADVPHRHEWRRQPPAGDARVYGEDAPDGKLSDASGVLVKVSHKKCFHADKKQRELAAARAADAGAQPPAETDWRHQEVVDVEVLAREGHRDNRGAGAAGR